MLRAIKYGQIKSPSGKLDFLDSSNYYTVAAGASYDKELALGGRLRANSVAYRHADKANGSFYDGHVESGLKATELYEEVFGTDLNKTQPDGFSNELFLKRWSLQR